MSYDDQKKLKTLQNKLSKIESQISDLEKKIKKDDVDLASDYDRLVNDKNFFSQYEKKKKDLEQYMLDWEQVQEEIDSKS